MQPDSTEKEDITRIPRIWGYASGGIIGLSGILAIFWWMGAELLFGLLFWGIFAVGFLLQIICGVMIGQKTPVINRRKPQIKALYHGMWIGFAFGLGISVIFLLVVIIIMFGFS